MAQIKESKTGLLVEVYKNNHKDCSANGVTSKFNKFILVFPDCPQIFEPSEDCPFLYAVKRKLFGTEYWTAFPDLESAQIAENSAHGYSPYFFGGNFVFTSDSRFPNAYPIPVHDRRE